MPWADAEGDQVVLDSETALRRALDAARNNTVVLLLQDLGDLITGNGAVPSLLGAGTGLLDLSPVGSPVGKKKRRPPQETSAGADFLVRLERLCVCVCVCVCVCASFLMAWSCRHRLSAAISLMCRLRHNLRAQHRSTRR